MKLDKFDVKILAALQENNQRTSDQLAELVHLSPATCLRRVKALRDAKIISADVSIVSPDALGRQMTMVVLVSLESDQRHLMESFKASMNAAPQVLQCYYVTGPVDMVMVISVRDMQDFECFTREIFAENRNVKRFETMVVINRTKFELGPRFSELISD